MVGELPGPTLTEKVAKRGRKSGPDLGVLIDTTMVGLFGLVAVATGHEHWLKERDDVIPVTGPLKAWVDQLPSKTLKRLEKNLAPTLLVVGLATVLGPDLVVEMKLREQDKRARIALSAPKGSGFRPVPVAGGIPGPAYPANGRQPSPDGWHSSIPAGAPVGSEFDV